MRKTVLLLFYTVLLPSFSFSQAALWISNFDNGTGFPNDFVSTVSTPVPRNMKISASGNIFVCGYSKLLIGGGGDNDFSVVKYNNAGTELWHRFYPDTGGCSGTCGEFPRALALDDSDNVYVFGNFNNGTIHQFLTIKYDSSGILQWTAVFDTGGYDMGTTSMAVSPAGNVYVCGYDFSGYPSSTDIVVIKYNSSGIAVRHRVINGVTATLVRDIPVAIAIDADENVYIAAEGEAPGNGIDYETVKLDSVFSTVWSARYNGSAGTDDLPSAIAVDTMRNVYVTGKSTGIGSYYDMTTVKYNAAGTEQWVKRYDGAFSLDVGHSIAVDDSGKVYVTGESAAPNVDYMTIAYDSAGTQLWASRETKGLLAMDIAVTSWGDVFVTGSSDSVAHPYDIYTVRYNSAGIKTWEHAYNDTTNDFTPYEDEMGFNIAFDWAGNPVIYGHTVRLTGNDLTLINYDLAAGIYSNTMPFSCRIFPNPSRGTFQVEINSEKSCSGKIELSNVLGKEIIEVDCFLKEGINKIVVGDENISPGIYFVQLKNETKVLTRKLIIQH